MSDPIPLLRAVPNVVDKTLMQTIRDLLAKAQSGEIDGLAFATVGREGPKTHWYNSRGSIELMAAIAHLQWRYHHESELRDAEAPDGPA